MGPLRPLSTGALPVRAPPTHYLRHAALALAAWGPTEKDWPVSGDPNAKLYALAADAVVDLCGGKRGLTLWSSLSKSCSDWSVNMLKCQQACRISNNAVGFGECMQNCEKGVPDVLWCRESSKKDPRIEKHCTSFLTRWGTCEVSTRRWSSEQAWHEALDKCVFNCSAALEIQKVVGETIDWQRAKCNPRWFACASDASCHEVDHSKCTPPLGTGSDMCHRDDLDCGKTCPQLMLSKQLAASAANKVASGQPGIQNASPLIPSMPTAAQLPTPQLPAPQMPSIPKPNLASTITVGDHASAKSGVSGVMGAVGNVFR